MTFVSTHMTPPPFCTSDQAASQCRARSSISENFSHRRWAIKGVHDSNCNCAELPLVAVQIAIAQQHEPQHQPQPITEHLPADIPPPAILAAAAVLL